MDRDELLRLLAVPQEMESIEFKEAKSGFGRDRLLEYCVAIANSGGGTLVLGVADKAPRQIVGTSAFQDTQEIRRLVRNKLGIQVDLTMVEVDGKRVLAVGIPSRPVDKPLNLDGRFLKRSGDENIPMDADEIQRIRDKAHLDFSASVCSQASIADLSPDAIARLRELYYRRTSNAQIASLGDHQLLVDFGLLTPSGVTYAALILLGRPEALSRYLPQAEVVLEYRFSESSISHQDRREFQEGFLLFNESIWELVDDRNTHHSYYEGMLRRDIPALNEIVVREALLNAVSHRDYRQQGSIFLRQYPSRIMVESPGGFPEGVNSQNILTRQMPRNRLLADVLLKCGLVERSGQGVDRMFREAIREGKAVPDYSASDDYQITVDLDGEIDERFLRFLEKVGNEAMETFTTEDLLVLHLIHREEPLSNQLRSRIQRLRDLGVIETIGRGKGVRYLLSRRFYEYAGEAGAYTRRLGLDRETNKQLLVKHIEAYPETGCRLRELREVLPGLSNDSVRILLRELKGERKIHVWGRTRGARWFPGPPREASGDG